jgi:hypothetical protein
VGVLNDGVLGLVEKNIITKLGCVIKIENKEFNCDGNVWITPKSSDIELMRNQPISKMRVTNGRNYESYTFDDLDDVMKNYFINLFKSLDDGNINGFDLFEE